MEDKFEVHQMTKDDLRIALNWAASEGWNPGIDDVNNFYLTDPGGFFIGKLNDQPISCISIVRYPPNFNFVGIYIVKSEFRKQRFGFKTWQEAFKLINDQPAALDAVLQQVNTYQKSGFKPAHSHIRYQGIISGKITADLQDIKTLNFEQLCHYDGRYFPSYRPQFLAAWINQPQGQGYAIINKGELQGYGMIRKATDGFRIGPLFAENQEIANKLLLALATYASGSLISVDIPNINQAAISLSESYQMKPIFECVRMYRGEKPLIDWQKVFGVTTLELG